MKIVHVTPEAVPVAKTGGLADVAGALPAAQAAAGHEVAVILPFYGPRVSDTSGFESTGRAVAAGEFRLSILRRRLGAVEYLLLDAPRLFVRPGLYGTTDGDFPDNPIRFAAFSRGAVRAAAAELGGGDIFHCHDWQAALVPQLIGRDPLLEGDGADTPVLLTLHNLAYQGSFEPWVMEAARLPAGLFDPKGLEFFGRVNYLKGGILAADALTTVSPTYAREILTPQYACGLEQVLGARRHRLQGILNGLDTSTWNPARDPFLPRTFHRHDVHEGKAACRAALARELSLDGDPGPLIGVVARLVHQKGADILAAAAGGLAGLGVRLAVLGSGDPAYEASLEEAARVHRGRIAFETGFNEPLAHRIYAGADFFLMPSRFEPCGLGQMIALRYGTPPIVNPVGGLADTVRDIASKNGNGFHLADLSPGGLIAAVRRAVALYKDPERLLRLRRRGMSEEHGWAPAVRSYEAVYRRLRTR